MPVVRQGDDGAEGTHRGILVTTVGRERAKKGNRRVKGLGSDETAIAGLDICYWIGHPRPKRERKIGAFCNIIIVYGPVNKSTIWPVLKA